MLGLPMLTLPRALGVQPAQLAVTNSLAASSVGPSMVLPTQTVHTIRSPAISLNLVIKVQ
jgi:hypothetical protein